MEPFAKTVNGFKPLTTPQSLTVLLIYLTAIYLVIFVFIFK